MKRTTHKTLVSLVALSRVDKQVKPTYLEDNYLALCSEYLTMAFFHHHAGTSPERTRTTMHLTSKDDTSPALYLRQASGAQASSMMSVITPDGSELLGLRTSGIDVFIGKESGVSNTSGTWCTALGSSALRENTTGVRNTAVGYSALASNTTGIHCTAVGESALASNTTGARNTGIGLRALNANTTGLLNTATGNASLLINSTGTGNTATGAGALQSNLTGNRNTANGVFALAYNSTGSWNVAAGAEALYSNTSGANNCAAGAKALWNATTGTYNTAVGWCALDQLVNYSYCTGIGQGAQVTGSRQVQIGDSSTTTYTYGSVQNRSDRRDKADIRDTLLGLDFIMSLRPVDFRWDMRDDYRTEAPPNPGEDASDEEREAFTAAMEEWSLQCKLANIVHDGSKKRQRYHHGLIAQEVKQVMESKGIDFGGYQDHVYHGGDDVQTIGYEELIAPLIKAIQQQQQQLDELKAKIQ